MANKQNRHPLNVEGKFWVDQDSCLACDTCQLEAPENFEFNKDTCSSYVSKQPESEDELKAVRRAIFVCAVEAIIED
jgi:ferredoxin